MLVVLALAVVAGCDEENNDWGQAPLPVPTLTINNGAAQVDVATVNVNSSSAVNSTVISAEFEDTEADDVEDFTVTIKIRLGTNETTLVDAKKDSEEANMAITGDGAGNYTATYDYDPSGSQALGNYDLHFEVSRGSEQAVDGYDNNADELTLVDNFAPTLVTGTTTPDPAVVDVDNGIDETTISADFADLDEPLASTFRVTCRIQKGIDTPIDVVVDDQDGDAGVDISGTNGQYTVSITFNPEDGTDLGLYSIYFAVEDLNGAVGAGIAIDDYLNNPNELEIVDP